MTASQMIDPSVIAALPEPIKQLLARNAYAQRQQGIMMQRAGEDVLIALGLMTRHSIQTQRERKNMPLKHN